MEQVPQCGPFQPEPFRVRTLRRAALCQVLAQSADTKPLLSARRVLQIRIEEKSKCGLFAETR